MISAIVVDDEEPARERIRALLAEHREVKVVAEAENGIAAIEKIEELQPDLAFLDIQMPGCTGIEVVRSITTRPLPRIIFCTAYDQYAIEAFELNAIDYLLKPVTRARLAESLKRITGSLASTDEVQQKLQSIITALAGTESGVMRRFLGRRLKRIYVIHESDVIYFKVDRNLVIIVTDSGEYWTNYTLSQIETSVDPTVFVRTHRQSIVNLNKIKEIASLMGGTYLLTMINGSQVEASRRQSKRLLELLK